MTTTIQELLKNLKHYPDNTVVIIKDVDDGEFAIVDFLKAENNSLTIIIGEIEDEEDDQE